MALKPLCMLHLAALLAMCRAFQASASDKLELMADKHKNWMSQFSRAYQDEEEKAMRFKVFQQNAAHIEAFNQQANKIYTLALNKFADLTNQEFVARYTGYVSGRRSSTMKSSSSTFKYAEVKKIPESIDWRRKGAVTLVKDQGQCGCCWIFSAIAALEGFYKINTGELISWSEQQLLDCDASDKFHDACTGGTPYSALQIIIANNGLMAVEPDYTYTASRGYTCRSAEFRLFNVYMNTTLDVPPKNESALMAAVAMQPVSVSIDSGNPNFQFYNEGIYKGPCGTNLNHAVAMVGYGVDSDGTKYWVLKNSWGTGWGEKGFMRLQKDVAAAEGLCGLAIEASYPTDAPPEQISP